MNLLTLSLPHASKHVSLVRQPVRQPPKGPPPPPPPLPASAILLVSSKRSNADVSFGYAAIETYPNYAAAWGLLLLPTDIACFGGFGQPGRLTRGQHLEVCGRKSCWLQSDRYSATRDSDERQKRKQQLRQSRHGYAFFISSSLLTEASL